MPNETLTQDVPCSELVLNGSFPVVLLGDRTTVFGKFVDSVGNAHLQLFRLEEPLPIKPTKEDMDRLRPRPGTKPYLDLSFITTKALDVFVEALFALRDRWVGVTHDTSE